jgi:superfamily II DNA or RNA helicase
VQPRLAEHQERAVERALLLLNRFGGCLLADDVGLGKSFIAAEVAKRSDRAVDFVVPTSLIPQWRENLEQFGLSAELMTHDSLLRSARVPDPDRLRLVVVDEAHAFRNPHTQRYAALARLSVGANLLLVTATPFCNRLDDLRALVDLIAADDSLVAYGVPSIDQAFDRRDVGAISIVLASLAIRRGTSVLPEALRFGVLERRVVRHAVLDVTAEISALEFPLVDGRDLLRRFLWRRLESSEEAILESIRRQLRFYERARECLARGTVLHKRDYRKAFVHEEDRDAFQQVLFWELFVPPAGGVEGTDIDREVERLGVLRERIERSPRNKVSLLREICVAEQEPMLVFTTSTATARALVSVLPGRTTLLTSREPDRAGVIAAFERGLFDRLVCTDLAAEGLNLQRAGIVVHYDLPWNPVKLDQRNGRALRIGQTREVVRAIYFLPEGDGSGVMAIVSGKNRARRRILPFGVGDAVDTHPAACEAGLENASSVTLPPRVTRDAAIVRFCTAAERIRLEIPPALLRRHRAGTELLLKEMSSEYLDEHRLKDLIALLPPI